MSWAARRRTMYLGAPLILLFAAGAFFVLFFFSDEPTCFDGVQNGDERGVDCGGSCVLLCSADVRAPSVLWSRALPVTGSIYNLIAYIDNPNASAAVFEVGYLFKIFDEQNLLIAERRGTTFLSPGGVTPVFEGGIGAGTRIPARTFFEFTETPVWRRAQSEASLISLRDRRLSGAESSPRLDAVLENTSVADFSDIEVVATIFNADDNAIAVSKTVIARLNGRSSAPVVFTWPAPFPAPAAKIDIIPRIPPKQ